MLHRIMLFRRLAVLAFVGLALARISRAQEPSTQWTFSLGARESNEFSRVRNGIRDEDLILDNVSATLRLSTRRERSRFGLHARIGGDFYREGRDRARVVLGGGFAWDRDPSPRLKSNLSAGVHRGFTAKTLSELGALSPEVRTTGANARWRIQYQMGPRTSVSTSLAYNFVHLETDRPITGSQIVLADAPFQEEFSPILGAPPPETGEELELPDPEIDLLELIAREGFSSLQTRSHAGTGTFGLSRQLTEYSSLGFDFGGGYRTRDDASGNLREGADAGFRLWTEKRVGTSSSLGASYQLRRSLVVDPSTIVQSLVGGYSYHPQGRRFSLRFLAGATHYRAESLASAITPSVNASFFAALSRSTSFAAAYRREFAQSLGFGSTLLIDYGSLRLTQEFGRKVDLSLVAGASLGTDPLLEGTEFNALKAGATLTYNVVESFSVGTSFYTLDTERRSQAGTFDATRNLWSIYVSYSTSWR